MKVVVETLGCKVNAYESELIKEMFINNKDEIIDDKKSADVIVINTCTVTNQADSKGRKLIRQARRDNENAILIVCGCMTQNHEDLDIDADIIPCTLSSTDSYNDFKPTVADGSRKQTIIDNMNTYSAPYSEISFDSEGKLIYTLP